MDTQTQPLAEQARMRELPPPPDRRQVRLAAGFTSAEMARALGVQRRTLHRWECGRVQPIGASREKYAAAPRDLGWSAGEAPQVA